MDERGKLLSDKTFKRVSFLQKLLAMEILGKLSPLGERRALRCTYKYSILAYSCTGSIDPVIAALLIFIL